MNMDPIRYKALYQRLRTTSVSRTTGIGSTASIGPATEGREEQSSKMDTITISKEAVSQRWAGSLASRITDELTAPDSPDRIEALRQAVSEGSYQVPADAVADAILDHIFFS